MNELIREIEEDIARERWAVLWHRFGKLAIGLIAALLLVTTAYSGWNGMQARRHAAEGEVFARGAALAEKKEYAKAAEAFAPLAAPRDGYPALAMLRRAGALVEEGKVEDGLKAYDELANAAAVRREWRDIALVKAAAVHLDRAKPLPEPLRSALVQASAEGRAFHASASEMLALDDLVAGRTAAARTLLTALAGKSGTPDMLGKRAEVLLEALSPDAPTPTPAAEAAKP